MDRSELMGIVKELPEPFRKRITFFAGSSPEWLDSFGPTEVWMSEEAVKIANYAPKLSEIVAFYELSDAAKRVALPELSERHSLGTLIQACHLALLYLIKPEDLWKCHGCACSDVGCEAYGCYTIRHRTEQA